MMPAQEKEKFKSEQYQNLLDDFSANMLNFALIKIDSSSFDILGKNQVNICFRHQIFKTRGVS
jgi:hypothetical protein